MHLPWPVFLSVVAVRTACVFFMLVVGVRRLGKRMTGEMNTLDLLMLLVISNAVQNAMTMQQPRLGPALTAAGTLIVLGWLLANLTSRYSWLETRLIGMPTVIAENGMPRAAEMRREGVTENELMAAVRDSGLAKLSQVKLGVLEIDGSISIVPVEALPVE